MRHEQPRDHCDPGATLWSGGFPCQDLSVAGKRAGLAGARSGLAYTFLDLVERHRPPAILLENVPGLLSSNGGKDLGALLGRLGELGYWWAYRILDAQFFGVPQRRRRVFICALHAGAGFGADSAAAVLSVGARCGGHSAAGDEAGRELPSALSALTSLRSHGSRRSSDQRHSDARHRTASAGGERGPAPRPPGPVALTPMECERLMGWPRRKAADDRATIGAFAPAPQRSTATPIAESWKRVA